jgi:hypothetical protein
MFLSLSLFVLAISHTFFLSESHLSLAQYRSIVINTYAAVKSGECKRNYDDLIYCNGRYEDDYAKNCKSVREALQECVVKNKLGELGK